MKPYGLMNKVARCKEVVIQNMERTIQHKMFYMYLKDKGIQNEVKQFAVNGKDGIIRVEFIDTQSTLRFYETRSFNDKLLLRRFNIYLDVQCSPDEIKKYFLKGINEKNIREVFDLSRRFGVVRLNTRFNRDGSLQDKCIISFIRLEPFAVHQLEKLNNFLKEIGVTIDIYKQKGESRVKPDYSSQLQESKIKVEESRILALEDKITLLSVHSYQEKEMIRSYREIQERILGIVEQPSNIDIYTNIVSAPQYKAEQIITIAQIEHKEDKIGDQFLKICDYFSQNKLFPIIYLTTSKPPTSRLILLNRTSFTIRSSNGKCQILKRLQDQQKYIKILQIPYEQIDDFYSDDKTTHLTFWNAQQLQISGQCREQQARKLNYSEMPFMEGRGVAIADSYLAYLIVSAITAAILLVLLIIYGCKFYPSVPITGILALLIFNDLLQLIFEMGSYFQQPPVVICIVSIIGTTFFRLAAYYWIIFITKLIYRQKVSPDKHVNLPRQLGKNLVMTYVPSIIVAVLILIVGSLDDTQSKSNCWRIIQQKELIDYIIYLVSFIFPNAVAMLCIGGYLIAYFRLRPKKHTIFVVYPIVAIPFMAYELTVKITAFLGEEILNGNGEIPLIIQPLTHGVIFAIILCKLSKKINVKMSDLTLKDEDNSDQNVPLSNDPQEQ